MLKFVLACSLYLNIIQYKYIMPYLFNCACLVIFLAVFNLREMVLHDSSAVVTFCMHDADKAVVLVSSSDKLSSKA